MKTGKWLASEELLSLFQAIGRASLSYDIQDSHSGNMAVRWTDEEGQEKIVITATGAQKAELEQEHICFLSTTGTDYGYYKASSETDIHVRILSLPGVFASMHAHVKELTMATMDDLPKPARIPDFVPVDPLGYYYLGRSIPVDWFAIPSGSPEMAEIIPQRLKSCPLAIIFGHGALARGRNLKEAFFHLAVGNNSGRVVRLMWRLGVDVEKLRQSILAQPELHFPLPPPPYDIVDENRNDFSEEEEIRRELIKANHRIFESRLSPFFTGSISLRGVEILLYCPQASRPRDINGPFIKLPLGPQPDDSTEVQLHKLIYSESDFQTVIHTYIPEAEACAHFVYPEDDTPTDSIIPIDAEGSFIHLMVPVLPSDVNKEIFLRSLHDYKMVVVRGGGVWAVGHHSVSEVLHHPSSLRDICLYRIGAFERRLNLKKMEPEKARKW